MSLILRSAQNDKGVAKLRRPGLVSAVIGLAYLALPGHPLGWLTGLPLGPLGLAVLILFSIVLFAAGPIRRAPRQDPSPDAEPGEPAPARRTRRSPGDAFALAFGVLALLKVALWLVSPAYGVEATYFGKPSSSSAPPERSTEFLYLDATRLDRALRFADDSFPLYFFNDNVRFNYYQPDEPDRAALPFNARWRGMLEVPADGDYRFWLTAAGAAHLRIAGTDLRIDNRGAPETAEQRLSLGPGQHPFELTYNRRGNAPALLAVEWDSGGSRTLLAAPALLARPTSFPWQLAAPLRWLSHLIDGLYLASLALLSATLLIARYRPPSTNPADESERRERAALALVLVAVFAYAALSSLDLRGRVVLLDGGSDWLTYETYARDILLDGPLMTLGRPLGRGRPYFFQPFYPYALAAFHWLAGEDLYGAIVLQLFGLGVAAVLTYYLGKRLFGVLSGTLALAIVLGLLGPLQLDWVARRLLSENIYFWLLPATALAFIALSDRPSRRLALLAGALLGLCCITRGPTLLWVPPVLVLTWLRVRGRAGERESGRAGEPATGQPTTRIRHLPLSRSPALPLSLAALACAAVIALVPLRNYVVSGRPTLLATNGMATMALLHPLTPKVNLDGVEKNPIYRALKLDDSMVEMIEFVRQDPQGYLATLVPPALYALGLPEMLESGSAIRWELLGLVALYGVYLVSRSRLSHRMRVPIDGSWFPRCASPALPLSRSPALLLHAFIGLHFLTMVTFLPNSYGYRQVLPMYLFVAIFAGATIVSLGERLGGLVARPAQQEHRGRPERRAVEQHVQRAGAAAGHEELA